MKINKNIKSIIIGCIIAMGVSYVSADWSGPKIPPPNCITDPTSVNYNEACNAPINIGLSSQAKTGDLTLVRSFVGSLKVINDFTFATGTPTAGQVLTAVDGTGKVKWANVAAVAGGGVAGGPVNVTQYSFLDLESSVAAKTRVRFTDVGRSWIPIANHSYCALNYMGQWGTQDRELVMIVRYFPSRNIWGAYASGRNYNTGVQTDAVIACF